MRAAIYARVSPAEQTCDNQLLDLRRYIDARGWTSINEYVDVISGAKDRRPGLDDLVRDARRRKFDVVVCWRLDRLGRNLPHLVTLLDDFQALGVAFVSMGEGI
jgi:DNA invertase Pin-like site-specific DNA recombinase